MTDGVFRTFRSDGSLQFDAGIAPYVFHSKGVVNSVSTTGSSPHWSGQSPSSALIPMNRDSDEMIAVYLPGYGYARYGNVAHPTTGVWYHVYHTMAPIGTPVTYYRFVPATELAPASYGPGIELRNESGQLTFHSDMRPSIVVAELSGHGSSITLPPGRNYASVVQSLAGYEHTHWDSGGPYAEENDKGQIVRYYWSGSSVGRLYGVKWNAPNNPSLAEVLFNDIGGLQAEAGFPIPGSIPRPSDTTFYDIEIENVLFIDVTGI